MSAEDFIQEFQQYRWDFDESDELERAYKNAVKAEYVILPSTILLDSHTAW